MRPLPVNGPVTTPAFAKRTEIGEPADVGWHAVTPDNPYHDLLGVVCQQHQFNFLLWHEEDIARHARRIVRLRDGLIESDLRQV